MNSASLCSLAGRYDNPIPPRFLAPIDFLKIPAPFKGRKIDTSIPLQQVESSSFTECTLLLFFPTKHRVKNLFKQRFRKHPLNSGLRIRITLMRIRIQNFQFTANPDPAYQFTADTDPAFHFNADSDPAYHFTADPDPAFHQSDGDLRPLVYINFFEAQY
jgi:hypothetical protein